MMIARADFQEADHLGFENLLTEEAGRNDT
jgi:hypothetical protein